MKRMSAALGFNVLELLSTLVIVAILALIAIPAYQDYRRKVYFSEVIAATAPFKTAVGICIQKHNGVKKCNAGMYGIPGTISAPKKPIYALTVNDGVITVMPLAALGVKESDTFVLTPAFDSASGSVKWVESGVGVVKGYSR